MSFLKQPVLSHRQQHALHSLYGTDSMQPHVHPPEDQPQPQPIPQQPQQSDNDIKEFLKDMRNEFKRTQDNAVTLKVVTAQNNLLHQQQEILEQNQQQIKSIIQQRQKHQQEIPPVQEQLVKQMMEPITDQIKMMSLLYSQIKKEAKTHLEQSRQPMPPVQTQSIAQPLQELPPKLPAGPTPEQKKMEAYIKRLEREQAEMKKQLQVKEKQLEQDHKIKQQQEEETIRRDLEQKLKKVDCLDSQQRMHSRLDKYDYQKCKEEIGEIAQAVRQEIEQYRFWVDTTRRVPIQKPDQSLLKTIKQQKTLSILDQLKSKYGITTPPVKTITQQVVPISRNEEPVKKKNTQKPKSLAHIQSIPQKQEPVVPLVWDHQPAPASYTSIFTRQVPAPVIDDPPRRPHVTFQVDQSIQKKEYQPEVSISHPEKRKVLKDSQTMTIPQTKQFMPQPQEKNNDIDSIYEELKMEETKRKDKNRKEPSNIVTDKPISFQTYSGQAMELLRHKMESMIPPDERQYQPMDQPIDKQQEQEIQEEKMAVQALERQLLIQQQEQQRQQSQMVLKQDQQQNTILSTFNQALQLVNTQIEQQQQPVDISKQSIMTKSSRSQMIFRQDELPQQNNPFDHDDLYLNQFLIQPPITSSPVVQPDSTSISQLTNTLLSDHHMITRQLSEGELSISLLAPDEEERIEHPSYDLSEGEIRL